MKLWNQDIKSRAWICIKGGLFAVIALLSFFIITLAEVPHIRAIAALLLAWSAARFYYFLFYVLENYVDPTFRYAGLYSILVHLRKQRRKRP
mgnify:CR=1 FL=1